MKRVSENVFITLLEIHKGILYKITNAYVTAAEDRKDLFQEIVVNLWKAFPSFKENSKVSTWIYRVALYTAITNYRRQRKQPKYNPFLRDFRDESANSYCIHKDEQVRALYLAIDKLSSIDKAIILLLLEEKSYEEISQIMGIKPANAGMRIMRAKQKLAALLINIKA